MGYNQIIKDDPLVADFLYSISEKTIQDHCDEYYDADIKISQALKRDFSNKTIYLYKRNGFIYVFDGHPASKFPEFQRKKRKCLGIDCDNTVVSTAETRLCFQCNQTANQKNSTF